MTKPDDDRPWFATRRYGYGSGMPLTWQGWVTVLAFVAAVLVAPLLFRDPVIHLIIIGVLTIGFVALAKPRTVGTWRWRWGDSDDT